MKEDRNRRAGIAGRVQRWMRWPFRILDTETTGLHDEAEVVSIAVIDHRGEVLVDTLIRPERGIPADATAIHGIRDEDVAAAPRFGEVYPAIARALDARRWAGYNVGFDAARLRFECERAGLPIIHPLRDRWQYESFDSTAWIDVMEVFAEWYGQTHHYYGSYTWQKLVKAGRITGELYFDLESELGRAHGALADAEMTLRVLKGMGRYE